MFSRRIKFENPLIIILTFKKVLLIIFKNKRFSDGLVCFLFEVLMIFESLIFAPYIVMPSLQSCGASLEGSLIVCKAPPVFFKGRGDITFMGFLNFILSTSAT